MYREKIAKLMEAVKDDPYDLDFIEERVNSFTDYVSWVTHMETRMQRLKAEGVDGQEWRDEVTSLDKRRRSKHDVAMDSINQLNRMSEAAGLEPFYEGTVDHDHRTEIGDIIGDIVNEYFKGRGVGQLTQKDLMEEETEDFARAVEGIGETSGMER